MAHDRNGAPLGKGSKVYVPGVVTLLDKADKSQVRVEMDELDSAGKKTTVVLSGGQVVKYKKALGAVLIPEGVDDESHTPVGDVRVPTTREELRYYLSADMDQLRAMRDFVIGKTKKKVYGAGIPLILRDTPAMNALLDEWLAGLQNE